MRGRENPTGQTETETRLEAEYLRLAGKKPTDKITVTELCRNVGMNRSAFYSHYLDIPDLEEKIITRVSEEFMKAFRAHFSSGTHPEELFRFAFDFYARNEEILRILFEGKKEPILRQIVGHVQEVWGGKNTRYSKEEMEQITCFLCFGAEGLMRHAVHDGTYDENSFQLLMTMAEKVVRGTIYQNE